MLKLRDELKWTDRSKYTLYDKSEGEDASLMNSFVHPSSGWPRRQDSINIVSSISSRMEKNVYF